MDPSIIKLSIVALLPVAASAVFYLLQEKTSFGKLSFKTRQIIIGLVFGGLAVIGNEWGIPMEGALVNCRDAAVLCGGLLFGGPAGIIAGLIGGIERWFAVYWGVGSFTRVACSVSTMLAGFYAAFLKKYLLDNKRTGWLLSFEIGVVMEVIHLTMVFLTNMSQAEKAIAVVKACAIPMVLANGLSVTLAGLVLSILAKDKLERDKSKMKISERMQSALLIAVCLTFVATSYFVYRIQSQIALSSAEKDLKIAVKDVKNEIVGVNAEDLSKMSILFTRTVGQNGFLILTDKDFNVLNCPKSVDPELFIEEVRDIYASHGSRYEVFKTDALGFSVYAYYEQAENHFIIGVISLTEVFEDRNTSLYINTFMEILVFAFLFVLIYFIVDKQVVRDIQSINKSLKKISSGDLSEKINVRNSIDFNELSDDINATVDTLKGYIDAAEKRMEEDLNTAKAIQASAMPNVFPAFPKRKEFDIFASMDPAKEVGGDFYDMYLTHSSYLNFLVADVSGKGIPAAMFMMRAKTELEAHTKNDHLIDEVFVLGNNSLCDGNDAGMFVTAWQGGINLKTGMVEYVNAGHNPPLVKHADGRFEYLKSKVNLVLAAMPGVKYTMQTLQLEAGDIIFLYTDGVTEATDKNEELYGEDRLLNILNSCEYDDMQSLCKAVRADVDKFVGDAPQFDDITMLAVRYLTTSIN